MIQSRHETSTCLATCKQNLPKCTEDYRKTFDHEIKIKLNRKMLYPTLSVKYLGVKFDENLK